MAAAKTDMTLENLLDPVSECLTPEAATRLVNIRASPELQNRLDELADKNTEGVLTPQEREEYQTYVLAGRVISILQAKARRRLREHTPA
jgi:hypothetical protein